MSEDSMYVADMKTRVIDLEYERMVFLARPSVMLGVKPYADGDRFCALHGESIMQGVAGFGVSPDLAMADFDKAWCHDVNGK